VDFLQQKNRELERKLADARLVADDADSKLTRAQARVRDLEFQLKDADVVAKRLHADKDVVVRAADREMGEAKVSQGRG
jgi:protein subunit release factor A